MVFIPSPKYYLYLRTKDLGASRSHFRVGGKDNAIKIHLVGSQNKTVNSRGNRLIGRILLRDTKTSDVGLGDRITDDNATMCIVATLDKHSTNSSASHTPISADSTP